jgi:hypothetical protein
VNFINTLDRTADELVLHLVEKDLLSETMVMYINDNGYVPGNLKAKGEFAENGYRVPFVVYNGANPGGGVARSEFAHAVDVRATVTAAAGDCPAPGTPCTKCIDCTQSGCGTACSDPCSVPCPDPELSGQAAYAYSRSLLDGTFTRDCEFPQQGGEHYFTPQISASHFKQCQFGMSGSGQNTLPGEGWYVLAEVEEPPAQQGGQPGPVHLCKFYRQCASNASNRNLFDLTCDPNERKDIWSDSVHWSTTNFCATADGTVILDEKGDEFCNSIKNTLENLLWYVVNVKRDWNDFFTETCFDDEEKPYVSP